MGGACGTDGREEKCIVFSLGKREGKKPFGRARIILNSISKE
jgi:hypothetical protein